MINYGTVYSTTRPQEIEITNAKVFIASDIEEITIQNDRDETVNTFVYKITEYSKEEFMGIIAQNNKEIAELQEELAATKILLGVE